MEKELQCRNNEQTYYLEEWNLLGFYPYAAYGDSKVVHHLAQQANRSVSWKAKFNFQTFGFDHFLSSFILNQGFYLILMLLEHRA